MDLRLLFLQVFIQFLLLPKFTNANDVGEKYSQDKETWENNFGYYPYKSFRSNDLVAPAIRKATDSPECHDDNYVFIALRGKQVPRPALMILDNQGELVWEQYVKGEPYNLDVQEYRGEKVLTYWIGDDTVGGHGEGIFYIYNNRYEEIAKISGSNGLRPDLHEFIITPAGTALITIYQIYVVRQPGVFKLKDTVWIWDCVFQEVDISTGEKVFEWRASDHHSLNETYRLIRGDGFSREHPWDWYHINSVQKDEVGNYLVSARYTNTITYINGTTGDIIWVLGGKRNTFKDLSVGSDQAINMAYQHDARFHNLTEFPVLLAEELKISEKRGVTRRLLTAFDNAADDWTGNRPSRGVLIEVTYPTNAESQGSSSDIHHTARLVKSYEHTTQFIALSQGSMQVLPSQQDGSDPKVLIGYGHVGVWTEFSANGKVLCDNHLSTAKSWPKGPVQSYRTLKSAWIGEPAWSPTIAFGSGSSLFVSWNGATRVRSWKLQKLQDEDWIDMPIIEKKAFETEIQYEKNSEMRFLRVVALDKDKQVLGVSAKIDLKRRPSITNSPTSIFKMFLCLLTLFGLYKGLRRFGLWRRKPGRGYDKLPRYE